VNETAAYAKVKVEGADRLVVVPISFHKPEIPGLVYKKWQGIVDLVAGILHVPTGLLTRLTPENLEIFVASNTEGNPYKRNDKDRLGIGMFCETVVGTQMRKIVDDTDATEYWKNNPHAAFGMHSYIGVPIQWEDGELFGTFCMLDSVPNKFTAQFIDLIDKFKEIIETDLSYILLQQELKDRLSASEMQLREIHHRLKNQFNILASYISLQSRGKENEVLQDTLKEIQHRVMALSLIHDELYHSERLTVPPLDIYLSRLCKYILNDLAKAEVSIEYRIENLDLPMNTEISLALIVSELLTNSLKHAFTDQAEKLIRIEVSRVGEDRFSLIFRDNGVGLPPGFDATSADSLGMTLLRAIAKQLGGSMNTANERGAVFRFDLAR
jgi:two-component sensor histidine kinase